MRHLPVWTALALIAVLASSACTPLQPRPDTSPATASATETVDESFLGLVGQWHVTGAEGQDLDTLLIVDNVISVLQKCGSYRGGWAAEDGHFVAEIWASDDACGSNR